VHWKLKARLQNAVARLPPKLGNSVYFLGQRLLGGLRQADSTTRLEAGRSIVARLDRRGRSIGGKTFLEIGTGHQLNLPIALWLCGAGNIITVDLNRYLREDLVRADLEYLSNHVDEVRRLFGEHGRRPEFEGRLTRLIQNRHSEFGRLLDTIDIRYMAPCDAAELPLAEDSIDFHVSYTVLEHIPPDVLTGILREGNRVLRRDGLFVHCVDFSDHFSHSDSSVSSVNFLQFSEDEWARISGNRFMYHNRLRVDECESLFAADVDLRAVEPVIDPRAQQLLQGNGFSLDRRFREKSVETNATSHAWIIAGVRRT
jgi:SAM-dependent methyltransferase